MQQLIAVVLKSIIVSAMLFSYYSLFLRNRQLNKYNRFYLLGGVIASMAIPFLHLEWYAIRATTAAPVNSIFEIVSSTERETQAAVQVTSIFTTGNIVCVLYAIVSVVLLARTIAGIVKVYKIKAVSEADKIGAVSIIHTELDNTPFSFMNNIFWNDRTDIDSHEGKQILKHEMTHVEQHHTYDKVLMQLVCALFWINPIYWMMRKELSMVHEFLADGTAIENGDADALAAMLLQSRFGIARTSIVNSFYFSPIKRRLTMLTNTSNTRYSRLRKLLALPLALTALGLFSFTVRKAAVIPAHHKIVVMLDAGHGGIDDGGTNSSGLREKDLALQLTTRLAQLAPAYNVAVLQTRNTDDYVTLGKRAEAANNSNADVYLSVHVNKAGADNRNNKDYVVYVSEANARYKDSKLLAAQVANSLFSIGIKPEIENRKGLLVLQANKHPAILVECGNIDKPGDMARLKDPKRMDELCRTLLSGVVAYANNTQ